MKKAMFTVKRRVNPMLAVIVEYNEATGRKGKILASEPIKSDFSNSDAEAAAPRLVLLVLDRDIILPTGISL